MGITIVTRLKIKTNSVRYDGKQLHKSIGTSSAILNHFHQQSSCKAYRVTCNIAIESMKHIFDKEHCTLALQQQMQN